MGERIEAIYRKDGEKDETITFSEQQVKGYSARQIHEIAKENAPEGYELHKIRGLKAFGGLRKKL